MEYRNVRIDEPGKPAYVLGHAQDVSELREAEQQLRQLAMTDDLTGLLNRRGLLANGSRVLRDAVAHGKGAAVFYVDIDGLKAINDDHGHDAGSMLIVAAAEAMKNSFRAADVLASIGWRRVRCARDRPARRRRDDHQPPEVARRQVQRQLQRCPTRCR